MNILIISTNNISRPLPVMPAGACIVAEAAERAGHKVRLLDLMFEKDPAGAASRSAASFSPDVIGLSVRNIDNNEMPNPSSCYKDVQLITDSLRRVSKAPVILGGPAVGIMPEAYLSLTGAAGAVTGPGEEVFPRILACLALKKPFDYIAGVVTPDSRGTRGAVGSSGTFPAVPDFRRWLDAGAYGAGLASAPLQTKRGCPFECVYCTYGICEGGRQSLMEPEEAVRRAGTLADMGFKDIEFTDAVFNYPYGHAVAICEGLAAARTGARFQTYNLNPRYIDPALLNAMEKAGFSAVGVSAESGSDTVLKGLKKNFSAAHLESAGKALSESSLPCFWMFNLGGPGETEETSEETFRFAGRHLKPSDAALMSMGLRIYPGTELETVARREGSLSAAPIEMLEPFTYVSPLVNPEILAGKIRNAVGENMNYVDPGLMHSRLAGRLSSLMNFSGLKGPVWKHTRLFRGSLRAIGVNT